ncbi:response regulator [Acidisoma sp.]|uniref:response regulator n=1 Tax=Acidisoma sp. TaxID=1872115 RepID=UPI002D805DD6|nr:response regulator [Acidisoma sp.]
MRGTRRRPHKFRELLFTVGEMPEAEPVARDTPQTVLVVEDEILVRMVIADYLRDCGYRVIEAGDAEEALKVLQSSEDVHVVFSDVQMPGEMDGFGLARWIRQNQPQVKVLLTSGNAKAAATAHDLCEEGPLEAKPYQPQTVLDRIKRLLAENP